jgi:ribonuclease P protein 1
LFFRYLAKDEKISQKEEKLKEERRKKEEERTMMQEKRMEAGGQYVYGGTAKNTIMLRLQDKLINQHEAKRCYESLLFGEKLIFDMSYDDLMRPFDITNTVDQILEGHGLNKSYPETFYLYLSKAKRNSKFLQRLSKSTTGGYQDYPFTVTEKSYLDLFPKDDLVYLTPNAPDYLKEYDPYKIYIIGGLVDKVVTKPVTMAKAKREGIKMAKLPIDLHMR